MMDLKKEGVQGDELYVDQSCDLPRVRFEICDDLRKRKRGTISQPSHACRGHPMPIGCNKPSGP